MVDGQKMAADVVILSMGPWGEVLQQTVPVSWKKSAQLLSNCILAATLATATPLGMWHVGREVPQCSDAKWTRPQRGVGIVQTFPSMMLYHLQRVLSFTFT